MSAPQTEDLIAQLEALIDKVKPPGMWREAGDELDQFTKLCSPAAIRTLLDALRTATARAEALERENERLREALRATDCPNALPDDKTAGQCFDAGECTCRARQALEAK